MCCKWQQQRHYTNARNKREVIDVRRLETLFSGVFKEFVNDVLGPNDDVVYFQYAKKNNRESGPAVVGIELQDPNDLGKIEEQLKQRKFSYRYLNEKTDLFTILTP